LYLVRGADLLATNLSEQREISLKIFSQSLYYIGSALQLSQLYLLVLLLIPAALAVILFIAYLFGSRKSKKEMMPAPSPDLSAVRYQSQPYSVQYNNSTVHSESDVPLYHTREYIRRDHHRVPDKTRTVELRERYKVVND